ncbi:MAG: BON domain-containing protein [Desulfurivibrionaceae bacterium]
MKLPKLFSSFFLIVLLVSFFGCASTATKEGTGEYIDDSVITTKVKTEIFKDDSLKSSEINVETFKGVVQLSGFVNSQADINKAVAVARTVKGVASVKNNMQLKQLKKKAVEGC